MFDIVRVIEVGVGLFATEFVNSTIISPTVQKLGASMLTSDAMKKGADAGTTFGSAWLIEKGADLLGFKELGERLAMGGYALGAGKTVTIPFTGISLSATVPSVGSLGKPAAKIPPANPGSTLALNPGSSDVTTVVDPNAIQTGSLQTYGSTGDQYVFSGQGSATSPALTGGY